MAEQKRTNNDLQNTTRKTKDRTARTSLKTELIQLGYYNLITLFHYYARQIGVAIFGSFVMNINSGKS
jgi:hypothetical protein